MKSIIRYLFITVFVLSGVTSGSFAQTQTAEPPDITKHPVDSATHAKSADLMLYVQALPRDEGSLTYQWFYTHNPIPANIANGFSKPLTVENIATIKSATYENAPIIDATSSTLDSITPATAGIYYYWCLVTNTNGAISVSVESHFTKVKVMDRTLQGELKNGDFQEYYGIYPLKGQTNADNNYMHIPVSLLLDNTAVRYNETTYTVPNVNAREFLPYWNTTHEGSGNGNGTGEGNVANGKVIELQDLGKTSGTHEAGTTNFPDNLKGTNATGHAKGNTAPVANATTFGNGVPLVAELSAEQKSSIYQDIATVPGKIYEWSIQHGSVNANEKVAVVIGPAMNELSDYGTDLAADKRYLGIAANVNQDYPIGGTANSYYYRTYSATNPALYKHTYPYGKNDDTYFRDIVNTVGTDDGEKVADYNGRKYYVFISTAPNKNWITRTGFYSVPEGAGTTVFAFVNVASTSGTAGNFLDNIVFHSGNKPIPASAMFYSGHAALSTPTLAGYAYGITEVRGSNVSVVPTDSVTFCTGTGCTGGTKINPYVPSPADATITNWYSPGAGNITFNNLIPSKTYRIVGVPLGAISGAAALNTNTSPDKVLDNGYYTEIAMPAAWVGDGTQMATATASAISTTQASIYVTNTNPNVEYALLDKDNNNTVIATWRSGLGINTGAALIFNNLLTGHNYLVVARPKGYHEISYAVAATTSSISVLTPGGGSGALKDIQRQQVTRVHSGNTDVITLSNIDSRGAYAIYDPTSGIFLNGGLQTGAQGSTMTFSGLDPARIYHLAVKDNTNPAAMFMVGVRVYPFAGELSINYESEWVKSGADSYIPKTVEYRLQAEDTNDTWLIGNGNVLEMEDANTWFPATGTSQLMLGLKRGELASILDSMKTLQAETARFYYRTHPVEVDGWTGPSIAPESAPFTIPCRPAAPVRSTQAEVKDYTIDYTDLPEAIAVQSKAIAYSLNYGGTYTTVAASGFIDLKNDLEWTGSPLTIPLRFPSTSNSFASDTTMQKIEGRGPAPTQARAEIDESETYIRIVGLQSDKNYQYKLLNDDDEDGWIGFSGGVKIDNLDITSGGNDYLIRYAPTYDTPASLNQGLSVPLSVVAVDFGSVEYGYTVDESIIKEIILRNVDQEDVPFTNVTLTGDGSENFTIIAPDTPTNKVDGMDGDQLGENNEYKIAPVPGLAIDNYHTNILLTYTTLSTANAIATADVYLNVVKATWANNLEASYSAPTDTSFHVDITGTPAGAMIEYSINATFDRQGTLSNNVSQDFKKSLDGLEPMSAYTIYYKLAEDASHYASEAKTLTAYTAYQKDSVVYVDYETEMLNMIAGKLPDNYEISVNGVVVTTPYQVSVEADNGFTVSVRRTGPDTLIPPSEPYTFTVAGRTAAPTGVTVNATNDVISLAGNFQYRHAGNANLMANWLSTVNATVKIEWGGYEVRTPATTTQFASKFTTVYLVAPLKPAARKLYVDIYRANGTGKGDGSSWEDATSSFASAVEYATPVDWSGGIEQTTGNQYINADNFTNTENINDNNTTYTSYAYVNPTGIAIATGISTTARAGGNGYDMVAYYKIDVPVDFQSHPDALRNLTFYGANNYALGYFRIWNPTLATPAWEALNGTNAIANTATLSYTNLNLTASQLAWIPTQTTIYIARYLERESGTPSLIHGSTKPFIWNRGINTPITIPGQAYVDSIFVATGTYYPEIEASTVTWDVAQNQTTGNQYRYVVTTTNTSANYTYLNPTTIANTNFVGTGAANTSFNTGTNATNGNGVVYYRIQVPADFVNYPSSLKNLTWYGATQYGTGMFKIWNGSAWEAVGRTTATANGTTNNYIDLELTAPQKTYISSLEANDYIYIALFVTRASNTPNVRHGTADKAFYWNYNSGIQTVIITNPRNRAFILPPNVTITGGYDGQTGLANTTNASSILSGDFGTEDDADDAYHVVIAPNYAGTVLNGFVITGGKATGGTDAIEVNGQNIAKNNGGGLYVSGTGTGANNTLQLINVLIHSNTATNGGGIYVASGTALLTNVTISGNTASSGGGINRAGGTVTLQNGIVYGNTANETAGTVTSTNSLVGSDPLFVNAADKNYRLQYGSPAFDTGNNGDYLSARNITASDWPAETDLAGKNRRRNDIIDRGAYEYQPVVIWKSHPTSEEPADNVWSAPGNWEGGVLPAPEDSIKFHSDAGDLYLDGRYTALNITNTTASNLIIQKNAALKLTEIIGGTNTALNFTGSGKVSVQSGDSTGANGALLVPKGSVANAAFRFYSKGKGPDNATNTNQMSWQYFGVPVKSFLAENMAGGFIRRYNETQNNGGFWEWINNEDYLTSTVGYEISRGESHNGFFNITGELFTKDTIVSNLTVTEGPYGGQHLISNPYAAGVSVRSLEFGDNMEKTVYLFNTGTRDDWEGQGIGESGDYAPGQYIAIPQELAGTESIRDTITSMQAFVVRVDPDGPYEINHDLTRNSLKFKYDNLLQGNTALRRVDMPKAYSVVTLSETNGHAKDKFWIFIDKYTSRGYDNGYDGYKIFGDANLARLYTRWEGKSYQVSSQPDIEDTWLFMKAETGVTQYTLTFHNENLDTKFERLYLFDAETNTTTDITASGSSYNFTATNVGSNSQRFLLTTKGGTGITTAGRTNAAIQVYQREGSIVTENDCESPATVWVYSIQGNLLYKTEVAGQSSETIAGNRFAPGFYIVRAATRNGAATVNKKIVIR